MEAGFGFVSIRRSTLGIKATRTVGPAEVPPTLSHKSGRPFALSPDRFFLPRFARPFCLPRDAGRGGPAEVPPTLSHKSGRPFWSPLTCFVLPSDSHLSVVGEDSPSAVIISPLNTARGMVFEPRDKALQRPALA